MEYPIHVKNNFRVFIPISGEESGLTFTQTTSPSFGITLTRQLTNESWHYQFLLYSIDGETETHYQGGFVWAKRTPHQLLTRPNTTTLEGLYIRIKIDGGLFDFRRIKERAIRLYVNCFHQNSLIGQGQSPICQLFPKRRQAESDVLPVEVVVPITWMQQAQLHSPEKSSDEGSRQNDSPPNEEEDSVMLALNGSDNEGSDYALTSDDQISLAQITGHDDQHYMVLYNGNAEVIGNFRALNFYKASDVNIKEDIKLISKDRDPRGVLLKIDGVEYKFKKGITIDSNRRFVGYIAQQVESVVPEAVQLIDGILHVDYESLLPYLSEAIKQNFRDLNDLQSKTDQIHKVVDLLYTEFLKKEQKRKNTSKNNKKNINSEYNERSSLLDRKPQKRKRWMLPTFLGLLFLSAALVTLGVVYIWPSDRPGPEPSVPISPNTPSITPTQPMTPTPLTPVTETPSTVTPTSPVVEPPTSPPTPIVVPPVNPPVSADQVARMVLAELYNATDGPHWKSNQYWLTPVSVCNWVRVTCDGLGNVVELNLSKMYMNGTVPTSIGKLEHLRVLDLSWNVLSGAIPTELGNLNLTKLSLANTYFTGVVPFKVFGMTELTYLDLSSMKMLSPWEIPPSIGELKQLTKLRLRYCNLVGTITEQLSTLPLLKELELSVNQLTGPLPNLEKTSLTTLNASSNGITGSIPPLPNTDFDYIWLGTNRMAGSISNLNMIASIKNLDLSHNEFASVFDLNAKYIRSLKTLIISYNTFASMAPDLLNTTLSADATCDAWDVMFQCPVAEWIKKQCSGVCTS